MAKPTVRRFLLVVAISLIVACTPHSAFAQRGGGGFHGSGGFHGGGGGFHGGGGFGGGGFRGGSYHGSPTEPRSMGGGPYGNPYSRPSYGYRNPYGNPAGRASPNGSNGGINDGRARSRAPRSQPPTFANADGQWHSFGERAASTGSGPSPREFSPTSRNAISRTQALSNIESFFGRSSLAYSRFNATSRFSGSRIAGSRPVGPTGRPSVRGGAVTGFNSGIGWGGFNGRIGPNRSGNFNGFGGFRSGCWNCGFGFGRFGFVFGFSGFGWGFGWNPWWNWGFGWPWLDFGYVSPFWEDWYNPWLWPAYSPYFPPAINYNFDSGNYSPYQPEDDLYSTSAKVSATRSTPENGQSPPNTATPPEDSQDSAPAMRIFLKDGTSQNASSAWLHDGELHYTRADNGNESEVGIDDVDWQNTIEESAKRGVPFTLKSEPGAKKPPDSAPNLHINTPSPDGNGPLARTRNWISAMASSRPSGFQG